jgi:hypothetical protein
MYDPATYREMSSRDPEWVDRYLKGKWGASSSAIHYVSKHSIVSTDDWTKEQADFFLEYLFDRGALYRVLDHGDAAPTCCGWFCTVNNIHIWYREYYVPNAPISYHRQNINDLTSEDEEIIADYADPACFKKSTQKQGATWTVADEYSDEEFTESPPIYFSPADNNEFATRNRINEFLLQTTRNKIPEAISDLLNPDNSDNVPAIYFIRRSDNFPLGCEQAIIETSSQRKKLLGSDNGKAIYSDDRDKSISDHAYDVLRYYVAMHSKGLAERVKTPPKRSFAYFNRILKNRSNRVIPV